MAQSVYALAINLQCLSFKCECVLACDVCVCLYVYGIGGGGGDNSDTTMTHSEVMLKSIKMGQMCKLSKYYWQ